VKEQHFGMNIRSLQDRQVSRHGELGGVLELLGLRIIGGADGPRCRSASQSNQADRADEVLRTAVRPLQSRGGWLSAFAHSCAAAAE
jgi:hypothetical protein